MLFGLPYGFSQDVRTLLSEAYQSYYSTSDEYIQSIQSASQAIREWRKKYLAETFDNKLSLTEQNLFLGNQSLINEFDIFLKKSGSGALDDVLLIRLAQLQFEKASLQFNKDIKRFQKENDPNLKTPIPQYTRTIHFAKKFLEFYPESLIGDKAYYLIGYCSEEMMNTQEAQQAYRSLIERFPISEYGDEVSWRLAEIYFGDERYKDALPLYEKLAQTRGPFFTKSLYKLAATEAAQKNFSRAANIFQKLLYEIDIQQLNNPEDLSLKEESLDYLSTFLSQKDEVVINEKLKPELFYRLGLLYKKRLDEKSMRKVYSEAIQKYSKSRFMPDYYAELINSYDSNQDVENANQYRSQFIQNLTNSQAWWNRNDLYKDVVFKTQDMLEYSLLKSAEYYADKGYIKKDFALLKIARDRYFDFITQYSWSSYRDHAKLELADIEYYLGNYIMASKYYFEIVGESQSNVLREEAAYSLIWSEVQKAGYRLNFETKSINLFDIEKSVFSEKEKAFIQAALFYKSKIPKSYRRAQVLYKLAELYLEHGDMDNAVNFLNNIVSDNETPSATVIQAYRFLSEIYNFKGDYASYKTISELYHTTLFYADVNTADKENYLQKYRDKLETALNLELQGKNLEAAQEFEKISIKYPNLPFNSFLNLKVASLYLHEGSFDKVDSYLRRLDSGPYKAEALFLRARKYYLLGQYNEAIKSFEQLSHLYPKHAWIVPTQLNIVMLQRLSKNYQGVVDYVKNIDASSQTVYAFYDQLESYLFLKKYDLLYKRILELRKANFLDANKLQSYIIKAQLEREDYVGLVQSCNAFQKMESEKTRRTAEVIYDMALCEQYRLRTVLGKEETGLESIVGGLNKIYSYKIDEVTLATLNDILSRSKLKETNRLQFSQLMQRGWMIAKKYPLYLESIKLSQNIFSETKKVPVSLSFMQNLMVSLPEQLEWRTFIDKTGQWQITKLSCESRQFSSCLDGLVQIYEKNPGPEVLENILIASLRAQDDLTFEEYLKKYKDGENQRIRWLATLADKGSLLPSSGEMAIDIHEPLSLFAKGVGEERLGFQNRAQETFIKAIQSYPHLGLGYLFLARHYMTQNLPELALMILQNGFQNTNQVALLPATYQLAALVYSNPGYADSDQDQSPAAQFSIAYAALKVGDVQRVEKALENTKQFVWWFDMIKTLQLIYTDAKNFVDKKTASSYVMWLQKVQKVSAGAENIEVAKGQELAKEYPANLFWLERSLGNRDIAAEKR